MEKELLPYYLVVDLKNLCYVDPNWNFATLENAKKFDTLEEAEKFVGKAKENIRKSCAIYKVHQYITLDIEKFGVDVEEIPDYVIKHNIYQTQTSSAEPWNKHLKDSITTTAHYGIDSEIVKKGEEND